MADPSAASRARRRQDSVLLPAAGAAARSHATSDPPLELCLFDVAGVTTMARDRRTFMHAACQRGAFDPAEFRRVGADLAPGPGAVLEVLLVPRVLYEFLRSTDANVSRIAPVRRLRWQLHRSWRQVHGTDYVALHSFYVYEQLFAEDLSVAVGALQRDADEEHRERENGGDGRAAKTSESMQLDYILLHVGGGTDDELSWDVPIQARFSYSDST